jgi:hypothetical protein
MTHSLEEVVETNINVKETNSNIGKLQKEIDANKKIVKDAILKIVSEYKPLPEDLFWICVDVLNKSCNNYGITQESVNAFMSNLIFGHSRAFIPGTEDTKKAREIAARFFLTFCQKKNALYTPLHSIVNGFGDDSFGDLVDSFILFGQERYELALQGKILGSEKDQYQGENYLENMLEAELVNVYAQSCVDLID